MRPFAVALLIAVALACGSGSRERAPSALEDSRSPARYGLSLRLPEGWGGRIERGLAIATTLPVPADLSTRGTEMRPDDVVILLDENGGTDSPYIPLNRRLAVRPSDFLSEDAFERARVPAERGVARRAISIRDREFVLTAVFGRVEPAADVLAETTRVLASLSVESGDFYPGRVEPGGFDPAPGWFWGSGGRTAREAWGEHGALWASTRPLESDPIASWPDGLRALAPDDVFVLVWLSRVGPEGRWAERPRPYRLADAEVRQAWKGQPSPNVPEHLLLASAPGGIDVEVRVYFGRPDPTPAQREAAEAQLARLRLPDWGPWELE